MATNLRIITKSFRNSNMTGFSFQKSLRPCALDESSISIGMVTDKVNRAFICFVLRSEKQLLNPSTVRYGGINVASIPDVHVTHARLPLYTQQ